MSIVLAVELLPVALLASRAAPSSRLGARVTMIAGDAVRACSGWGPRPVLLLVGVGSLFASLPFAVAALRRRDVRVLAGEAR
jgi:hypothetical protein